MRASLGVRLGAVLAATAALGGCFAVVDVDRFHTAQSSLPESTAPSADAGAYLNFQFSLSGMIPHLTQLFEYRIIDSNNFIQSRGVIDPLGAPNVVINVPNAIPPVHGPFHLDFYADVNGSGGYDGIGSVIFNDHAWRIDPINLTLVNGAVQVAFTHNTSFTAIEDYPSGTYNPAHDTSLGALIQITNAASLQGCLIQVRVVDTDANRTVGLYRVPKMTETAFNLVIPGVVEPQDVYDIFVYVDANNNGMYDNPATSSGDLGWLLHATGTGPIDAGLGTLNAGGEGDANTDAGNSEAGSDGAAGTDATSDSAAGNDGAITEAGGSTPGAEAGGGGVDSGAPPAIGLVVRLDTTQTASANVDVGAP